jgi:hypothetical protein
MFYLVVGPRDLRSYSGWFLAAAVYNVIWGSLVGLEPGLILGLVGIPAGDTGIAWRAVAMQVLVWALAYWWASREPLHHRHLIAIGTAAKVLGVAGFLVAVGIGQLPWSFGLMVLANDVIWLPAFLLFVRDAARLHGWRALLSGA